MKSIVGLIVLIFCWVAMDAQVSDDFSNTDLDSNPAWVGDVNDFVVNNNQQLQLNGTESGLSRILTSIVLDKPMEWQTMVDLAFDPSSGNQLRIYLWVASESVNQADALYIEIGENGSNDALRLYHQIDGVSELLGSGTAESVARAPVFRVQAILDSTFLLTIRADYEGGFAFSDQIQTQLTELDISTGFFGMECKYTSSRSDKFIFDDIYIGPPIIDVSAPALTMLDVKAESIQLTFNEAIQTNQIDANNFDISPGELIIGDVMGFSNEIQLDLDTEVEPGIGYQLEIFGISDLAGNVLDTVVDFLRPELPSTGDILINEILFNPRGAGADFVELINVSEKIIALHNLQISNTNNGQANMCPTRNILPNEIIALTPDPSNIRLEYPLSESGIILLSSLPAFNNDDGNVSIRHKTESNDILLDAFNYDESFHHSLLDLVDGVSLERIDHESNTNSNDNWESSASLLGYATPGLPNSQMSSAQSNESLIELRKKIFNPNQSSHNNTLIVDYESVRPGSLLNLTIYNERGIEMVRPFRNSLLATAGTLTWDGRDANGDLVPIGIYMAIVNIFNPDGNTLTKKLTFAVAKPLD